MMPDRRLIAVVALAGPVPECLTRCLARFAGEADEVVLVDASGSAGPGAIAEGFANVRHLPRPVGRLAPELWRDGLLASESEFVATSTAQMVPAVGWRTAMLGRLDETGASGVGGPIAPGPGLSGIDRAVALLRYSGYFPGDPDAPTGPPGDNAAYRRGRLMAVGSAWADGFWEVEVHRALRALGDSLARAEAGMVAFEGGSTLRATIRQRFEHARRYGAGRAVGIGIGARIVRTLAWPLVPVVLARRAFGALTARDMAFVPWISAVPAFLALATAWAMGEAVGTVFLSPPSGGGAGGEGRRRSGGGRIRPSSNPDGRASSLAPALSRGERGAEKAFGSVENMAHSKGDIR